MIQGPNGRRPRGRHHGGGRNGGHDRGGDRGGGMSGNSMGVNRPRSAASLRHQTFDSNCIDVRVRGNAWQVHEKYQALARDAQSAGDRVAAENYLQHAEHYYRIIEAINEATAAEQPQRMPGQPGMPNAGFGQQQPEVPANYYGTDGVVAQPSAAAAPPAQAEVVQQRPPQQNNPFFAPDEAEDQGGPQPLVARR